MVSANEMAEADWSGGELRKQSVLLEGGRDPQRYPRYICVMHFQD